VPHPTWVMHLGDCAPLGVKLLPDSHFIRNHDVALSHQGQRPLNVYWKSGDDGIEIQYQPRSLRLSLLSSRLLIPCSFYSPSSSSLAPACAAIHSTISRLVTVCSDLHPRLPKATQLRRSLSAPTPPTSVERFPTTIAIVLLASSSSPAYHTPKSSFLFPRSPNPFPTFPPWPSLHFAAALSWRFGSA